LTTITRITMTVTLVLIFLCQMDAYAANRLLYENFNDQVIDSRLTVFGNNWTILSPPQYNLSNVGRDGTGRSFTSGTVDAAYLCWRTNVPNPWPTNSFYVSFWMRYPRYVTTNSTNENLKIFYPHWDGADSYVHYALAQPNLVYYSAKAKGTMIAYSRWLNCPAMNDGKWHHYEFYVNFATGASQFKYDGVMKVNDVYGSGKWTNHMYYFSIPSVNGRSVPSDPNPGDYTRQVDDVEIWDGMPSSTSTSTGSGGSGSSVDTTPPNATSPSPAAGAVNVPVNANIYVHVKDTGSGVDKSSIAMAVNGKTVTPSISGSSADYTLYYNPPVNFSPGSKVTIQVKASDLAGNQMGIKSCSFTTSSN
jgi:hypothetical protein